MVSYDYICDIIDTLDCRYNITYKEGIVKYIFEICGDYSDFCEICIKEGGFSRVKIEVYCGMCIKMG